MRTNDSTKEIASKSKKFGSLKDPNESQRPCICCHKRRIRCDLKRPECSKCLKRSLNCVYKKPAKFVKEKSSSLPIGQLDTLSSHQMLAQPLQISNAQSSSSIKSSTREHSRVVNDTPKLLGREDNLLTMACHEIFLKAAVDRKIKSQRRSQRLLPVTGPITGFEAESLRQPHNLMSTREKGKAIGGDDNLERGEGKWTESLPRKMILPLLRRTSQRLSTLIGQRSSVKSADLVAFFDYFEEVILDQMVPFDSSDSPYRKLVLPRITKSTELLLTAATISAGHQFERGEVGEAVAVSLNELSTKLSEHSYEYLLTTVNQGVDFSAQEEVFDECLNLLLQFSRFIFCCGTSSIITFVNLQNYLSVINQIFCHFFKEKRSAFKHFLFCEDRFILFVLQRLIFNDVFLSCLNDSKPVVDKKLLECVLDLERENSSSDDSVLLSWSRSIEITGCPIELLLIMHQIQSESIQLKLLAEKENVHDEVAKIFISETRFTLQESFREKLCTCYENYKQILRKTKKIDGAQRKDYVSLLKMYYHASYILLLRRIGNESPSSPNVIHHVNEIMRTLSDDINVGSGPDSCVAFPLFIAAKEAVLQVHRDVVLEFMDLSLWHLSLGSQKLAKDLLCNIYWENKNNGDGEALENCYLVIY